jgi:hypothetical protein
MKISHPSENVALLEPVESAPIEELPVPKTAAKKKFASKMRSIVSAVKTAQRLEVRNFYLDKILNFFLEIPSSSNRCYFCS